MKTLQNKKNTLFIEWNEDNSNSGIVLVLKQGAQLNPVSAAFKQTELISLRNKKSTTGADGKITTTEDITFKSKSALASFIQGAQTNGQRYCERTFGIPKVGSTITTPTNAPSSKEEEQEQEQEQEQESTTESETIIETEITKSDAPSLALRDKLAKSIITFCKDFQYVPDPRLLNSLLFESDPSQFILNSMELVGYEEELLDRAKAKFTSSEWKEYIKTLKSFKSTHGRFNQRLEIKYGSAGTGKTTAAIAEYPSAPKIVASASADPDDLFTFFDPSTKNYELTDIAKAMINGQPVIIDEANLYNAVVLQRLQGITDSTPSIFDRGMKLEIKDGFKVIMTLNLETNLGKTPLPNPLVSRASKIENYDNQQNLGWVW